MNAKSIEQSRARVRRLARRYASDFGGHDLTGELPLRIYARARRAGRVLVATNDPTVRRWAMEARPEDLAVVVTSGCVTQGQAALIARLSSKTGWPIAFVGDADPMGLHAYLSLRSYLGPSKVRFCGPCDQTLDGLREERARPESIESLEQSAFDRAQLRVVMGLANLDPILGPRVSAVLAGGRKIELEALSYRGDVVPAFFDVALRVARARPARSLHLGRRRGT